MSLHYENSATEDPRLQEKELRHNSHKFLCEVDNNQFNCQDSKATQLISQFQYHPCLTCKLMQL